MDEMDEQGQTPEPTGVLGVRLTHEQRALIERAAARVGLTASAWVRATAIAEARRVVEPAEARS